MPPAPPPAGGLAPAGSGVPLAAPGDRSDRPPPPPPPPWPGAVADVAIGGWPAPKGKGKRRATPPADVAVAVAPPSDGGGGSSLSADGGGAASPPARVLGLWRRRRGQRRVAPRDPSRGRAQRTDSASSAASSSAPDPFAPAARRLRGSERASSITSSTSVFDGPADARAPWRAALAAHVDGLWGVAFIAAVTLVSLFLDDARLAFMPRTADRACEAVAGAVFAVFLVDTVLASLSHAGYFGRLWFWCDLVATASMALEVPSLVAALGGSTPSSSSPAVLARGVPDAGDQRARQIMRVLRVMRLLRVVKLIQRYQAHRDAAAFAREAAGGGPAAAAPGAKDPAAPKDVKWWARPPRRARVAQRLSDLTASRVVVGVLALLLAIPSFNISAGVYGEPPPFAVGGLAMVADACAAAGGAGALPVPPPRVVAAAAEYASLASYRLFGRPTSAVLRLVACNATLTDEGGVIAARRPQELAALSARGAACDPRAVAAGGVCLVTSAVLDVRWNSQVRDGGGEEERGRRRARFFAAAAFAPPNPPPSLLPSPSSRWPPCSTWPAARS